MKVVQDAAQAMDNRAGLKQHMRLKDIRQVTWHSLFPFLRNGFLELMEEQQEAS